MVRPGPTLYGHTVSSLLCCCRISTRVAPRHMRSCVSTWRQPENPQLGGYGGIALWNQHMSADRFGEQTYIKRGKGSGGMKGISTSTEQVAVWVNSFSVRPHWHRHRTYVQWRWEEQKPHGGVDGEEKNKHKEEGEGRRMVWFVEFNVSLSQ